MAREQGDETVETSLVSRRDCLKVTGLVVGSAAASARITGSVAATTVGYGEQGYGDGGYGGASTDPVVVFSEARDLTESSVTLVGEVSSMGTADSVAAAFQWRTQGASTWRRTEQTSVSSPSTYSETVTGLTPDTTYEVRAVVTTGSETTVTSTVQTVTTASPNTGPTVTEFDISISSTLDDDRIFTVNWGVEDVNHDLDTVEVVVSESSLSFNFAVTDVSGTTASGWDMFQFPIDSTLDVSLRVTDGRGNTTRTKKTITL